MKRKTGWYEYLGQTWISNFNLICPHCGKDIKAGEELHRQYINYYGITGRVLSSDGYEVHKRCVRKHGAVTVNADAIFINKDYFISGN